MLTSEQKETLIDAACEAQMDANVRWYWRKIEYANTAPIWIAYRIPDLQPWMNSGDMVPETIEVFRFTGEHAAKRFVRRKVMAEALDAVLSAPLPNQPVKEQGDDFSKTANSPGERG